MEPKMLSSPVFSKLQMEVIKIEIHQAMKIAMKIPAPVMMKTLIWMKGMKLFIVAWSCKKAPFLVYIPKCNIS